MNDQINQPFSDATRALFGFVLGGIVMFAAVQIFVVNHYDFENMQRGVRLILSGVNPWSLETRIPDFYNPPFAVLFLWPMAFTTPKLYLVTGGALLFAFTFYHRRWVGLAWFGTNSLLWLIAAGGIDMFVIGAGLLLIEAGNKWYTKWYGLLLRVLAYGILMIKPQGGIFIVGLYILSRQDWKGLISAGLVYSIPFFWLYPDWIRVIFVDPPIAQKIASQSIHAKFGLEFAMIVAVIVVFSRKWRYWELGGALAGILSPYGMPSVPVFLTLTAVRNLWTIPVIVIYSGALAVMTWVAPPPGWDDYYGFVHPLMAIYQLSMLALALLLACFTHPHMQSEEETEIAGGDWLKTMIKKTRFFRLKKAL